LILISSGIFSLEVPQWIIHPVAVIGGIITVFCANLIAILKVSTQREQGGAITAINFRIGTKVVHLAMIAICIALMATILGYLFVENFYAYRSSPAPSN